jgi:hypothetical protein
MKTTWKKGKPFMKGNLLVQYWYKNGKKHARKLMIIHVGKKVLSKAVVYAVKKSQPKGYRIFGIDYEY